MSMEVENEEDVWEEYWEAYDHADDIEREENYDRVIDTRGKTMDIHETLDRIAPESEAVDLSDLSTYAHGYLDAESKYRRMIEDGELVEVVRCKDCKHLDKHGCCKRLAGAGFWDPAAFAVDDEDYCSRGERRSDEQT